jgi:hypothetical protein
MTSRTADDPRPKIQWPASVPHRAASGRRSRGRRDRPAPRAPGARAAARRTPADDARPDRQARQRPVRPGPALLLAAPQERVRDSSNRSPPMPSVPSATRLPSQPSGVRPTPLFMFDRGLWATVALASRTSSASAGSRWTPCASSANSSSAPAAARRCTTRTAGARDRIGLVCRVLGHVDVQAGSRSPGQRGAGGERLVGEGERGMRADHPARQRIPALGAAAQEARVLLEAGAERSGPSRSVTS